MYYVKKNTVVKFTIFIYLKNLGHINSNVPHISYKQLKSRGSCSEQSSFSVLWCVCVQQRLKPSLFSVTNGSPHVKHKLIREGKVTKSLVQSHGKLVRVLLVSAHLHHRGRCGEVRRKIKSSRFAILQSLTHIDSIC